MNTLYKSSVDDEYKDFPHKTAMELFHPLLMNDQPVKHVAYPEDTDDAATKQYVDDAVSFIKPDGDWHVGTEADPSSIVMENDAAKITTRKSSGNSVRIEADHVNGGQIVMHSPVSMPGKAGKVASVTTDGEYGHIVYNPKKRS